MLFAPGARGTQAHVGERVVDAPDRRCSRRRRPPATRTAGRVNRCRRSEPIAPTARGATCRNRWTCAPALPRVAGRQPEGTSTSCHTVFVSCSTPRRRFRRVGGGFAQPTIGEHRGLRKASAHPTTLRTVVRTVQPTRGSVARPGSTSIAVPRRPRRPGCRGQSSPDTERRRRHVGGCAGPQ